MKILVTGGAGFVGSHVVEKLIEKNHFPIIVDNLSSGHYDYIKSFVKSKQAKFLKIDIRNFSQVSKIPKIDGVIHLAAIASVVESIDNPIYVNEVNVNGTLNMLEFCRKNKIKRFVLASSAAIYGDYEKKINENSPTIPTTVYGGSKLIGEDYSKIYSNLFNIQCICLRPFNIYGPRQNSAYAGVISKFFERIKQNRSPIIFGNGNQTRDFIHVSDVAQSFVNAVTQKIKNKFETINLASGKSVTINNLALLCLKSSKNPKLKPIHKKAIPGVVINSSTNNKKLKEILGITPSVKLEKGLSSLGQII